jgi:hypothetical protein
LAPVGKLFTISNNASGASASGVVRSIRKSYPSTNGFQSSSLGRALVSITMWVYFGACLIAAFSSHKSQGIFSRPAHAEALLFGSPSTSIVKLGGGALRQFRNTYRI